MKGRACQLCRVLESRDFRETGNAHYQQILDSSGRGDAMP